MLPHPLGQGEGQAKILPVLGVGDLGVLQVQIATDDVALACKKEDIFAILQVLLT